MKKLALIALVLLFSTLSFSQEKCSKYKNGTFRLIDKEHNLTFIIERNGNKQYEEIEGKNDKVDFDVTWTSDCTYTLHPSKETIDILKADFTLIVDIIEIKEHSLVLRMHAKETPNDILTQEVEVIKTL